MDSIRSSSDVSCDSCGSSNSHVPDSACSRRCALVVHKLLLLLQLLPTSKPLISCGSNVQQQLLPSEADIGDNGCIMFDPVATGVIQAI
jgi:hypothetical protein